MASIQRTSLLPQRADLAQPPSSYALGPLSRHPFEARGDRPPRDADFGALPPRISRQHLRETKTHKAPQRTAKKIKKKPKSRRRVFPKRNWTPEEDDRLRALVKAQAGPFNWSDIARHFDQRVGKQCRERWHNHLSDHLIKTEWSPEEDARLIAMHATYGNRWAFLSQYFPGRTDNMIKNRWNTTLCKRVQAGHDPHSSHLSRGSRVSQESAKESLPEYFKEPVDAFETAAELRPSLAQLHPVLRSGPGTTTSLEESRVDKIPRLDTPTNGALVGVAASLLDRATPTRFHLALSSPQFSIRIPVFNRTLADLRCQLLQR